MLKTVIIADDLTGANDTGAILAQDGFTVGTILKTEDMDKFSDFDVLCISTNSRGISKEEAYEIVKKSVLLFEEKKNLLFSKRIDSTLRGNVGSEIDSIIETLGDDTIAVVVASFPGSGRTCIGDYLLVNNVPLERTEVAKDPTSPVTNSRVTEIVKKQSKYSVGYVALEEVLKGSDVIKESILNLAKENRILVVDARTNEDIMEIAKGCIASKLKFVAIDPGTFTAAVAKELFAKSLQTKNKKKILCGIGSASNLTRKQIKILREKYNPLIVKTDAVKFLDDKTREEEINRVVDEIVRNENQYEILSVVTTIDDNDVIDFEELNKTHGYSKSEGAGYVTNSVADIVYRVRQKLGSKIGGIYTSGGDISAAFCEKIKSVGFDVRDEVVPLAIYSKVIGGEFDKTPMITKGGLVGDEMTLVTCIDYLRERI
ncbi:four-carbon acid sugar kinase family protein [Paraclostridium bifermentans]|uniref:four-carbon acid sugar kinase family protein n=1 Tax=Paraclostridium bifermentans TaxID=1490 RepID=UPI0018A096D9|nr:four-carbon acid sugar kinase family protein [Paraclostridium bifermentans]